MLDMKKADWTLNPLIGLYGRRMAYPHLFEDEDEFERRKLLTEMIMKRVESGDVDAILSGGSGGYPGSSDFLRYYYDCMDPADRYRITVESYSIDGYDFPRKLIIGLKKIRPADYLKDLPDHLADGSVDTLTVYRASRMDPCDAVKNEISWSVSKDIGEWFYNRYKITKTPAYLYQAKIRKEKVIAYTNGRQEQEIIQHGGVFDIKLLESYRQANA